MIFFNFFIRTKYDFNKVCQASTVGEYFYNLGKQETVEFDMIGDSLQMTFVGGDEDRYKGSHYTFSNCVIRFYVT